eukprot:1980568-Prymnesium_polylepis.1
MLRSLRRAPKSSTPERNPGASMWRTAAGAPTSPKMCVPYLECSIATNGCRWTRSAKQTVRVYLFTVPILEGSKLENSRLLLARSPNTCQARRGIGADRAADSRPKHILPVIEANEQQGRLALHVADHAPQAEAPDKLHVVLQFQHVRGAEAPNSEHQASHQTAVSLLDEQLRSEARGRRIRWQVGAQTVQIQPIGRWHVATRGLFRRPIMHKKDWGALSKCEQRERRQSAIDDAE